MRLRRVLWYASRAANPGARTVIGIWMLACFALAVALISRSFLEQLTGWGFLCAAFLLALALPRREMLLAFSGFGVAATAAATRMLSFLAVADNWSGSIIIAVAWGTVAGGLVQRCLAALEVILVTQEHTL